MQNYSNEKKKASLHNFMGTNAAPRKERFIPSNKLPTLYHHNNFLVALDCAIIR